MILMEFLTLIILISDDIKKFSHEIYQKHNVIIKYMETDKDHIHRKSGLRKKWINLL